MKRSIRQVSLLSCLLITLTAVLSCSFPYLAENEDETYTSNDKTIPVCGNGAVRIENQRYGFLDSGLSIQMAVSNTGEGYAHNLAVNVTGLRYRNDEGDLEDFRLPDDNNCHFFVAVLNPGESRNISCGIIGPGIQIEAITTTQTCQYLSANEPQGLAEQDPDDSADSQSSQAGNDGKYANPNSPDGSYRVILGPNPEGTEFEAVFTRKNFWTNLPGNPKDLNCQDRGSPNEDVDAYLQDDFTLTLDYFLDENKLKGNIEEGSSNFYITYENTSWIYNGHIENGWVRGHPDTGSWEFGGDLVFNIDIYDEWRCWQCTPTDQGCSSITELWKTGSKDAQINGQFIGSTDPDGTYSFSIIYEDDNNQFVVRTLRNQNLPEGFPLP